MAQVDPSFIQNLEEWVKMQKMVLETFREASKSMADSDRLELIVATRAAFQHIIRTIKAFDQWLQDPVIISHVTKEMLGEVWSTTMRLLEDLLKLDIKHTSEVRLYLEKLAKEGKLNPLTVWSKRIQHEEEGRRRPAILQSI